MKIKVSEATPRQLNWMVTKCEGFPDATDAMLFDLNHGGAGMFGYSTDWSQGGPIIEREYIQLSIDLAWEAHIGPSIYRGPTPLIAAMRCYVASKLGDEVDVPDALV